jgi:AbrB family looped-hinge helix DNA binding protein
MVGVATISYTNRADIPKAIRDKLKLKTGNKLIYTVVDDKMIVFEKPKS